MEEKERLLKTIEEVNNDDIVIQEWIEEENERLKYEGQISYAREEGREEGKEIGFIKGEEIGLIKGEENKTLEVIKNMLHEGADYNFISKVTGKTLEEIEEIANNTKE